MDWKKNKQKPRKRRQTERERIDADALRQFELMRLGMDRQYGRIEIKETPAPAGNPPAEASHE